MGRPRARNTGQSLSATHDGCGHPTREGDVPPVPQTGDREGNHGNERVGGDRVGDGHFAIGGRGSPGSARRKWWRRLSLVSKGEGEPRGPLCVPPLRVSTSGRGAESRSSLMNGMECVCVCRMDMSSEGRTSSGGGGAARVQATCETPPKRFKGRSTRGSCCSAHDWGRDGRAAPSH